MAPEAAAIHGFTQIQAEEKAAMKPDEVTRVLHQFGGVMRGYKHKLVCSWGMAGRVGVFSTEAPVEGLLRHELRRPRNRPVFVSLMAW